MISILTPTYNRRKTLQRLYESILNQTSKDLEWIVIDDGSSDETKEFINQCCCEKKINIKYFFQQNKGKHAAINIGVELALGDWIFIVDSDDAITPDAVEKIEKKIESYKSDDLAGICFRKADFSGGIIGEKFNSFDDIFLSATEAGNYFKGDLAYVFRRQALNSNKFPVFKDEKFVPELYIWNKITDDGKVIFSISESIYLCEYLDGGYTKNFKNNLKKNPMGFFIFYVDQFKREKNTRMKLKNIIRSIQCFYYILTK